MAANRVQLEAILKFVGVQVNPGVFNQISRAAAGMPGPVQQFNRNLQQSVGVANNVNNSLQKTKNQLTGSERAARLFLQRMAQFAILLPTFATLNKSIQGGVKFLFDFDAAIKDIIRVDVGKLGDKFDDIAERAFKLSDAFGTSALEAANTIKVYTQAGFELEKATELARLSILATKASTLDAAGATEFLLAATKQFKLEGQDLERALDSLVAAEDLSALEAQDIADAFRTGGNSLAQFGKDINDGIALIAGLREQTRKSGNEIGTFFKTLQTRIFAAGESRAAIESLGVAVQNLDGTLRPTLDVLNDLKVSFDGMTESQVANAAKAIAGVRQFESLIGTINSLDRVNQLSAASSNSAGAARKKEEVDAQKLSRRLDELVVAGQKLAFALGEAGATDFFKNTLKTITSMVDGLTRVVTLLDSIKVPVLPILAPLALKAAGQVFGLGGPGGAGGRNAPGGGGGNLNAATTQNVAALQQMAASVSQLTQQLRVLTGVTGSQIQSQKASAAATQASIAASRLQVASHQQSTSWYAKSVTIYKGTVGSIQNAGARFAVQYALLTVGVTVITAGLNALSDRLLKSDSALVQFAGGLTETVASGGQLAGQFAALGGKAALTAGLLGSLSDSITKALAAIDDDVKASKEFVDTNLRSDRLRGAPRALSAGTEGLGFLQSLGKGIGGRTEQQANFDKIFKEAFQSLSGSTKTFIKDIQDLKEVLFDPSRGKETIRELVKLDSAAFVNKEALAELRNSYDENGKSTLAFRDQLNLFLHSLGQVDEEVDKATGMLKNLIFTFKDMKELQELIGFAQSVNKLGRALREASAAPEDFATGIDKMRLEAQYAKEDFADAQRSFEALRQSLVTQGSVEAGFSVEGANKFIGELSKLLDQSNAGAAISEFLSKRTTEEKAFAEEFLKIDEDRRNAVIKNVEATSSLENEIYKRGQENLKAQREAAFAAADALAKFKNELINVGTLEADTSLMSNITKLNSSDVKSVLAGTSELPKAIQEVINSTFVDGLKRAEMNLSQVADETANTITPIEVRMASLREEIAKLGNVQPNTEKAAKKEVLERELAARALDKQVAEQDGYIKSLEALRTLTTETKKAQEEAARAEAERLKKTEALTNATHDFAKSIKEVNKGFEEFVKQRIEDLAQKQASAYEEVKSAQQAVLGSTEALAGAYRDFISAVIQFNGVMAEAKVRANLLGRDIGILNGGIVTFQDRLTSLNDSFTSVLDDANMSLEQRIQLETELAQQTLSFLQQAQDEIVNAGLGIFGQSAEENQGLQRGIDGLAFVAEQLGGSFENFLNMDPQELDQLSQSLLNLPVEFRQSILDALSFLPSTASIGGFSVEQLQQAIGQIGAGVAPEQGLPAIADLTAQQVEQLKILSQLGTEQAKLQLSQVVAAYQALEKAQEQLDVAKIQEERAHEGFERVSAAVAAEMATIETGNLERRELLRQVMAANNADTLNSIENRAQLFAEQNSVFREVGNNIVQGIAQAINARMAQLEAQTALNNFNTMQDFGNQAKGYIPNFATGNLSPREAAGLLHAASREKKMMPHGARLAVANTHEAIIPMYKNFAGGNSEGSAIAASINSIRTLDQTMVAAIAASVSNTLSKISTDSGNEAALDKISGLLSDLNSSLIQVRDSNLVIKNNTTGLATTATSKAPGAAVAPAGQEVRISLQTNQNNTVTITGLENLRDQLQRALQETTSKQAAEQLEALMAQLDPVFQALNERGIISSFGQSR